MVTLELDHLDQIMEGYAFVFLGRLEQTHPLSAGTWADSVEKVTLIKSDMRRLTGAMDSLGYDGKNRGLLRYMAHGIDDLATCEELGYFTQQHNEFLTTLGERMQGEFPDKFENRKIRSMNCAQTKPLLIWGLATWLADGLPGGPKYDAALHLSFNSESLREKNPRTDELLRNPIEEHNPSIDTFYLFFENLRN